MPVDPNGLAVTVRHCSFGCISPSQSHAFCWFSFFLFKYECIMHKMGKRKQGQRIEIPHYPPGSASFHPPLFSGTEPPEKSQNNRVQLSGDWSCNSPGGGGGSAFRGCRSQSPPPLHFIPLSVSLSLSLCHLPLQKALPRPLFFFASLKSIRLGPPSSTHIVFFTSFVALVTQKGPLRLLRWSKTFTHFCFNPLIG